MEPIGSWKSGRHSISKYFFLFFIFLFFYWRWVNTESGTKPFNWFNCWYKFYWRYMASLDHSELIKERVQTPILILISWEPILFVIQMI